MSIIGKNYLFWRDGRVDINEYPEEDILCLIPESRRTSKKYSSLEEVLWNKIETLCGKINNILTAVLIFSFQMFTIVNCVFL